MAIADKFIMSDQTAKGLVNGIKVGGFWGRLAVYLILYVPMLFVSATVLDLCGGQAKILDMLGLAPNFFLTLKLASSAWYMPLKILMYFTPPTIFFILIELLVRSWRRKNGFSVYKNIEEELRQREVDIYVAREEKARGKLDTSSDTKDLGYWFGLLEKGAITKEEYEKKKMELLS